MFKFVKHQKYRRQEIWEAVKGKDEKVSRNFHQSGYERINEDLFAFINIGYKGHAGQVFPNKNDTLLSKSMPSCLIPAIIIPSDFVQL